MFREPFFDGAPKLVLVQLLPGGGGDDEAFGKLPASEQSCHGRKEEAARQVTRRPEQYEAR